MKNQTILINGLKRLIDGQKQFASELGLHFNRVLPQSLQVQQGLTVLLQQWIESETCEAQANLQNLVDALVDHQMAMFAALDSVVLHAFEQAKTVLEKKRSILMQPQRLRRELQQDSERHYQKLIMASFITAYLKTRENLAGQDAT